MNRMLPLAMPVRMPTDAVVNSSAKVTFVRIGICGYGRRNWIPKRIVVRLGCDRIAWAYDADFAQCGIDVAVF
jgi:hypothetical protein